MAEKVLVGVDIGGSHVSIGMLSESNLAMLDFREQHLDSNLEPDDIVSQISALIIKGMKTQWSIVSIGIGCPGQSKNGILVAASNFPKVKNFNFTEALRRQLGLLPSVKMMLLNDADAAISAEIWSSSTKEHYVGVQNAAMVTLGTGVGLGLVISNRLFQGSNGLIEGGHMILGGNQNGRPCGCGQVDCVEVYSSATNTAKRFVEAAEAEGKTLSNPDKIGAKEVFEFAACGDEVAIRILDKTCECLAVMCINLCRVVDPQVIILGGGMSKAGNYFVSKVTEHLQRLTWKILPTDVKIVCASSIDHAGVKGAALAARSMEMQSHVDKVVVADRTTSASTTDEDINQRDSRTSEFSMFQVLTSTVTIASICIAFHSLRSNHKSDNSSGAIKNSYGRNLMYVHCALAIGQISMFGVWLLKK